MALLEASGIGKNFGDTKVLTAPDSTLQRLMEPKATTSPSGRANSRVRANSSQLSRNAPERRPRITDTTTHPFRQILRFHSARARSYLSARACMVPSAFSSSKAASTAAAASLPLRKATPYSSAFSSSTIFRLA